MSLYRTRSEWGSAHPRGGYPMGRVHEVIVHHFYQPDVPGSAEPDYERRVMRNVEQYHADKGWGGGTSYQFVVFDSGRAYEGRGWFRTGAHTVGRNSKSVSICFAINGDAHGPTEAAWKAAEAICARGAGIGALAKDYRVSGHTDYSAKSCPGTRTYPEIGRLVAASNPATTKHYAQAVVGWNRTDLEAGRVLAQAYRVGLLEATEDGRLVSHSHPGLDATADFAWLAGSANKHVDRRQFKDGTNSVDGRQFEPDPDRRTRDHTAADVAATLLEHPPETINRRGKPW